MNGLEPWLPLIVTADIVSWHDEALAFSGGLRSGPTDGCIERSLGAAWNACVYIETDASDMWRQELIFAGYLMFYLVSNNCFGDGNKRTGLAAAQHVLGRVGLTIEASEDELVGFVHSIADGTIRRGDLVVRWIAHRLTELPIVADSIGPGQPSDRSPAVASSTASSPAPSPP